MMDVNGLILVMAQESGSQGGMCVPRAAKTLGLAGAEAGGGGNCVKPGHGLEEKRGNLTSEKISTAVFLKSWGISRGRVRGGYDADVTGSSGVAEKKDEQAEKIGRGSGNLWCDSLLGVGILRSSEGGGC